MEIELLHNLHCIGKSSTLKPRAYFFVSRSSTTAMTNVDELFKRPALPSAAKRKAPPTPTPNEIYKAAKVSANGDVKGKHHATVSNIQTENGDDNDDEALAGPTLPPEDEEPAAPEDDEEGRFFGSGVSRNTNDVLDYIDEQDSQDAGPEKVDTAWLRRTALSFERKISKNQELRTRYEDEPTKFMASEEDLDAEIKGLSILTDHPRLYTDFAKHGCVNSLVSLLAHENVDIAVHAIEILGELVDDDIGADQAQMDAVVDAMLDADIVDLVFQNLERLDESNESDRSGVYHCLELLEDLASQKTALDRIIWSPKSVQWLLDRIKKRESPTSQNKMQASNLLEIFVQDSDQAKSTAIDMDAVDTLLQLLSTYRKRDPGKETDEEACAENLFNALNCLVETSSGKAKFVEAEGVELCLIMLKEGKFSKHRALMTLDYVTNGNDSAFVCERIVDAAGLKPLFSFFSKHSGKQALEHILGIFSSLLKNLPGDSPHRIRTLAKFVEKSFARIAKLVKIRREYADKLAPIDEKYRSDLKNVSSEDRDALEYQNLSDRLQAGLFSLQTVDLILAWLVVEDDGARQRVIASLEERDESLAGIKSTLRERLDGLHEGLQDAEDETDRADAEMLQTLMELIG